ncbi:MAG: hypothetical protein AB7F75_00185 [Planctomycetota bacterium]
MPRLLLAWALALPLVASLVSCEEKDDATKRRELLAKEQRRLESKVTPVIQAYLDRLIAKDVEGVYAMLSSTLRKERTLEDMKKHWAREGDEYARVAATSQIQRVSPQGIYAVAFLRSVKGDEYVSLMEEDGQWKIHMASESFLKLISILK